MDTVAAATTSPMIIVHPTTNATHSGSACRVYSYSPAALGNIELSSA